jgi:UDP-2-acetamido-3-amino-2,3-dideoxy-glucuronate N-acetyltransferase
VSSGNAIEVHPTALVESDRVGSRTRIWAFVHVMPGAVIGEDCQLSDHVFVEGGAIVGNRVTIKNMVMLWDGVVLEDDVFVGPNAVFTNDRRPRSPRSEAAKERYAKRSWLSPTRVQTGATIGANATILSGLIIGRYALVGAGAVVTKDVPPHGLVIGNPAQQVGWVSESGATLEFRNGIARCPDTGSTWQVTSDGIARTKTI